MSAGRTVDELVIWHEFDGPGDTSVEVLEEIGRMYEERYGIRVRAEAMSIADLGRRLTRLPEDGTGPDMAMVPSDMANYWEAARLSEVDGAMLQDFVAPSSLDTMRIGGRLYGVPVLTGNHLVLYVNKTHYPEAPQTWEELEDGAVRLREAGIIPLGIDLGQAYSFIPFLTAFGGWPIADGRISLNTDAAEQALAFLRRGLASGKIASMDGATTLLERFAEGRIGAIVTGEWIYNYLSRRLGDELEVVAIPAIGGRPAVSMCSSIGLIFPCRSLSSPRGAALRAYAAFMLSDECQRLWVERVQRIPAASAALARIESRGSANKRQLIAQLRSSRPMPVSPYMIAGWVGMEEGLRRLPEDGASRARTAMHDRANAVMAEVDDYLEQLKKGASIG
ncbi:extracellular solute-binding protein [Cohnella sp. GCM10020058]|uniref:sugar ABC transporter substrate-binding protein n=1 Tax=Cohnella sp. GCM10020058 TaxID=3317330 RepID=UPI0036253CD0